MRRERKVKQNPWQLWHSLYEQAGQRGVSERDALLRAEAVAEEEALCQAIRNGDIATFMEWREANHGKALALAAGLKPTAKLRRVLRERSREFLLADWCTSPMWTALMAAVSERASKPLPRNATDVDLEHVECMAIARIAHALGLAAEVEENLRTDRDRSRSQPGDPDARIAYMQLAADELRPSGPSSARSALRGRKRSA